MWGWGEWDQVQWTLCSSPSCHISSVLLLEPLHPSCCLASCLCTGHWFIGGLYPSGFQAALGTFMPHPEPVFCLSISMLHTLIDCILLIVYYSFHKEDIKVNPNTHDITSATWAWLRSFLALVAIVDLDFCLWSANPWIVMCPRAFAPIPVACTCTVLYHLCLFLKIFYTPSPCT